MRCGSCGARNTDTAAWCTQCFTDLRAPVAPGPDDAAPDDAAPDDAARDEPAPRASAARDVRTVDGEVEWRCGTCDGWNALARARCATCGAPREGFGDTAPPPALDEEARGRLLAATVLLPGLGHLVAGRPGTGLARAVLAVTWVGGAILVLTAAGGARVLPALPLLAGATVLWAGSVRDVLALLDDGRELLTPRVLLWLTGGVVLALMVTMAIVAGRPGAAG